MVLLCERNFTIFQYGIFSFLPFKVRINTLFLAVLQPSKYLSKFILRKIFINYDNDDVRRKKFQAIILIKFYWSVSILEKNSSRCFGFNFDARHFQMNNNTTGIIPNTSDDHSHEFNWILRFTKIFKFLTRVKNANWNRGSSQTCMYKSTRFPLPKLSVICVLVGKRKVKKLKGNSKNRNQYRNPYYVINFLKKYTHSFVVLTILTLCRCNTVATLSAIQKKTWLKIRK